MLVLRACATRIQLILRDGVQPLGAKAANFDSTAHVPTLKLHTFQLCERTERLGCPKPLVCAGMTISLICVLHTKLLDVTMYSAWKTRRLSFRCRAHHSRGQYYGLALILHASVDLVNTTRLHSAVVMSSTTSAVQIGHSRAQKPGPEPLHDISTSARHKHATFVACRKMTAHSPLTDPG
jgi:hypothetical protein